MKILVCFGTRPEAIKMAPVVFALKQSGLDFETCVTAQHRDMLDQVLDFFEIKPDYDLDLMTSGQTLNELSARIIKAMDEALDISRPEIVLVQGDTTTAAMTALAAFQKGIRIGHVEAGLRTFDLTSPYPEEMNRQLISVLSTYHFPPTQRAYENLIAENISTEAVLRTGNTVVDALFWTHEKIRKGFSNSFIEYWSNNRSKNSQLILVTAHRRENFGLGLSELMIALIQLTQKINCQIIWPVHPNPKVKEAINQNIEENRQIFLVEPVDYPSMIWLMSQCDLIISDSGGIQEEAPSFGVKVLVTRSNSERMEGVEHGSSILVGMNAKNIVQNAINILQSKSTNSIVNNPFGNGAAAKEIVKFLQKKNP